MPSGNEFRGDRAPRLGGMPGGMLALSSNGRSPNTGIVWGLAPIDPQTPRLKLLWDSQLAGVAYTHSKFCAPVVADAKLFVPTYDGRVDMYTLP